MSQAPTEPPQLPVSDVELPSQTAPTALRIAQGRTFPAQQQILLYSAADWEEFIREWAHYQKTKFIRVVRLAGAGDLGVDVAGFTDSSGFQGVWECFQCKHYDDPLTPTTAFPELGKILWHSFQKRYAAPRKYYFVAPKGCGQKLKKQLLKPEELKAILIADWNKDCASEITSKTTIPLEGEFLDYVNAFDFSIFTFKAALEILDEHQSTPHYSTRFGGGLPDRPPIPLPPNSVQASESRYITQLLDTYSEECGSPISSGDDLNTSPKLLQHFDRQREYFYSAEALRNFARDTVPAGTFEELQGEVYAGVVDTEQSPHPTSLIRLNAVTQAAANLPITANGLISVTKIQDKKGICHQLANEERLNWRNP